MLPYEYSYIEDHCIEELEDLMEQTPQDKKFHGEGNVLKHSLLVHDLADYRGLPEEKEYALRIAALMHDIGKVRTTQVNGNDIICPNHSQVGARMTREILWKKFGLAGTYEAINFRETIVNLVRFHGFPPHVLEDEFALAKMYRAAANSLLGATDFTMDLLYRLAKADMEGRICNDKDDALATVECFRDMAEQENILNWPPVFDDSSAYDTYRFLNFKTGDCKEPCLYDDTEVEVVLMCGLPGTGKDSWIMKYMEGRRPSTEIISLDDIRRELKLKPGDTNGIVIQTAKERAKEYLRQRQSFIWNATNITQSQRRQLVDLFETYKACVRIEYLETTVEEQKRRNHNRDAVVPQKNIDEMIGKLQLPEYFEAQYVRWNVV